jgi:EAL domain-containing protein (putative c-di-GMP-specific phosphodiesterase class I)
MIDQVCREIPGRIALDLPIQPVSVNFSAQDFDYLDINEELNKITDSYNLEQYGVTRRDFIIEITEQDIAVATDNFCDQLHAIRESGYRIWMDDFGSGYSSLNVLGCYDIDLIKLDMDFLRHLDDYDGTNRHIIPAIVEMARTLGIHTLAEGLETEDQLCFLRENGCELAQGFYFLVPESLEGMKTKYENGKKMIPSESPDEREEQRVKWIRKESVVTAH